MLDEIKARQKTTPFEPFAIRLRDGRELPVRKPEHVWLPVPGVLLYHHAQRGASESINPAAISRLEKLKARRAAQKARGAQ